MFESDPLAGSPSSPELPAAEIPLRRVAEKAGDRLGHYQLLEKLGEGGCGIVYLAEQFEPVQRRVALKVVKLGLGTEEVLARFEAERQALAMMEHPGIAKVFDAGVTDTGRPFFVMELVPGVPLTQFCEQQRLARKERLDLFVQVCRAIQHAHQKGIIHRDLKPSNILVTQHDGVGEPKIIDFGIAKATQGSLTGKTLFTMVQHFLGTPAYMSPEQAGLRADVDTRSDIYSLGVLLYELLTGRTPFESKQLLERGIEELILTLRDVDPPSPSRRLAAMVPAELEAVARSQQVEAPRLLLDLRRDLDWIVMKCLEKDRARRYETVNGLAMDIQRHLNDEPVLARPPTLSYRARKTLRRHRAGFLAGFGVLAALALGLAMATYGLVEANAQRKVAEQKQQQTREALARAEIAIAEAAYRENDGQAMRIALEGVPVGLRDTTWNYLRAHADTSQATIEGAFVGASAHPALPGVFVVTKTGGGSFELIAAKTGEKLQQFKTTPRQSRESYYRGLAISSDGLRLAVGSLGQGGIAIYDLTDGSLQVEWEAPETDTLEFSNDGRWLLQSSSIDRQVCLWEAATGQRLWRLEGAVRAVFDPADERVIAAHGSDLLLLDVANGNILRRLGWFGRGIQTLAAQPGGSMVAVGDSEGFVGGVDLVEGRVLFERRASRQRIQSLDFTGDGSRFVSVSEAENQSQAIHVWDAESGMHLRSILSGSGRPECLRIHPISDDLLITGPLSKTWALSRGPPKWTLRGNTTAVFFGGDTSCLAPTAQGVAQFSLHQAEPARTWTLESADWCKVAASANGLVAAVTSFDHLASQTRILQRSDRNPVQTQTVRDRFAVSFVRLSPAGDRLLLFVPGGKCSGQYNTVTGAKLATLDDERPILAVTDAVWLDGNRVVGGVTAHRWRGIAGSEEQLVLWDAQSGKQLRSERNATLVNCLAPSPDALRFAEAGDNKMIRIRDGATLAVHKEFRAHDASITALAWHPTRPILASASADLTIKLWDLSSGRCLEELRGPVKPVAMLHFSPNGERLVSAGPDRTRVWEPEQLRREANAGGK